MKKILPTITIGLSFLINCNITASAQTNYTSPPTSSTRGHVPVISDAKMEECVKLYNESKWLGDKLSSQYVNTYDSEEVNKYNRNVEKHSMMIKKFNNECAGKQSRSACEAAQKLNKKNGLPHSSCK